jgi:hypothetical protein
MPTTFRLSYSPARFFILIFSLLIQIGTPSVGAQAINGSQRAQFPRKVQAAFDKRDSQIKDELERLPLHDWAGEYHFGGGIGNWGVFKLAPLSGFVARWGGCTGVYAINYGSVVEEGGIIKLLTERPPENRESWKSVIEMLPVRWGERHYLIPADEIIEFCNAVNSGWEPDRMFFGSHFLLRRGDEKKEIVGDPGVPMQYREYLLSSPIEAEIVSLLSSRIVTADEDRDQKERVTRFRVKVGYAEGLRVGMELYGYAPHHFPSARVLRVSEHSAEAEMRNYGAESIIPNAGWKLSTRNY